MPPDTRIVYSAVNGLGDVRQQRRLVIGWANVGDGHGQEFLAPIAVMRHGGVIDFEERKGLKIINPHRQRICFEEAAITLLALVQRLLDLLALDGQGDLISHGREELHVALAISAFLLVVLHGQYADGPCRRPQRHTQPGRRIGPDQLDFALFGQSSLKLFGQQERLARAQHVATSADAFAGGMGRGSGINLVDPKLEMHQVGYRIVKSDEAVLRVKELADGTACEVEQLVEIGRRDDALDYVGDDLTFRLHPLVLRQVSDD